MGKSYTKGIDTLKLPEFLFPVINAFMKLLLNSPMHALVSKEIMLLEFEGRKSGRLIQTPVSYIISGNEVRCFTTKDGGWWYSFRHSQTKPLRVMVRIAGHSIKGTAIALHSSEPEIAAELSTFLGKIPGNAAYHSISLDSSKQPVSSDVEAAIGDCVLISIKLG